MSDVACVCSAPIVGEVRARGLDPMRLIADLGLSLADVEDPRGRIPWRAFVVFAQRAEKMLGAGTLEELAAAATFDSVPRPIRRMLPMLRDSRPLFALAARWWGPWVFRGTRGSCEVLPDGRVREIVQILPGYAACPEFLAGIRGTMRAIPRLLHQPEALVTLEQDGREGEYLITPPPSRVLGGRRAQRSVSQRLDGQSRRLETFHQLGRVLARGASEDAGAIQQEIARLVQERLRVGGVRLSNYGEDDGLPRELASGAVTGVPDQSLPLLIANRQIGLLEIWGAGEERNRTQLGELVPWIAFALEYGSSKALVAQLARLLEEDARDWRRLEARLADLVAPQPAAPSPDTGRSDAPAGSLDLARFLQTMKTRIHDLAGRDVAIGLHCADGLRPVFTDAGRLEAAISTVVEVLRDIGSEVITIEARAVADPVYAAAERTTAEILVRGQGGLWDEDSRGRLPAALELSETGLLAADLHLRTEPDGAVTVRLYLPMLATAQLRH